MTAKNILQLAQRAKKFDHALAIKIAEHGARKFPEDEEQARFLGNLYLIDGDLEKLFEFNEQRKNWQGEDALYFHNRGLCEIFNGRFESSLEPFERSVAIDGNIGSIFELCVQNYVLGNHAEAQKYCNQLLATQYKDSGIGNLATYLLLAMEPSQENQRKVQEAIKRNPDEFHIDVIRNIAARFHPALSEVNNKASFERLVRAANIDVNRPETMIFPEDGEGTVHLQNGVWLSKPVQGHGGQNIEFFTAPAEAPADPSCVLQRYVERPLLLHGRKFHVRVFMAITNFKNRDIYFIPGGIVRLAPHQYEDEFSDSARHITNTSLYQVTRDISQRAHQNLDSRIVWAFTELLQHLQNRYSHQTVIDRVASELSRIADLLRVPGGIMDTVSADWKFVPPIYLGVDIMFDEDLNVWVLEVQERPGFSKSWPEILVYRGFFRNMYTLVQGDAASMQTPKVKL